MADKKPAGAGLFDELDILGNESLNASIFKFNDSYRIVAGTSFILFVIRTPLVKYTLNNGFSLIADTSVVFIGDYFALNLPHTLTLCRYPLMREKCFGGVLGYCFSVLKQRGESGLHPFCLNALAALLRWLSSHLVWRTQPHPKTFQLRTIAALPEPAGRPTHGLLSRRSTDRISTSPLANFAQLSMFRFDGLIITYCVLLVNTNCD
ncbi:TPA: hypothetical protein LZ278_003608 [Enterobacter asburiae]|nr:hypothetical protein [Enterobacter asburiae]